MKQLFLFILLGIVFSCNPQNQQEEARSEVIKKWYPNKMLMEERSFLNGMKNGRQTAYWDNGNKRFDFVAVNDRYEGELKEWDYNGKLFHLAHYKNGQEEGVQKLWYENGKIRANYIIIQGKRYGLLGTKNCKNVADSIFVVQ
jgi:antitoxin component YwqK of YwqJK toxin-antitoxin module